MPKVKVPWLCSRSQPGIKVIIRDLRGHLLHSVTFLVFLLFFLIIVYSREATAQLQIKPIQVYLII